MSTNPKITTKVYTIDLKKSSLKKLAKFTQEMHDEMNAAGFELFSCLVVEAKGAVYTWRKMEAPEAPSPSDLLKALFSKGSTGVAIPLPFPFPGNQKPEGDEISDNAMQILDPISRVMSNVPVSETSKVLPQVFEQVTKGMPVEIMNSVADEFKRLSESHPKHCQDKNCKLDNVLRDVSKLLADKARLNTQ